MAGPLDEYTKQISLSLQGHPDAQAVLRWNKDQSRFELVVTFNVESLFQEYAAKGNITVQSIPTDRKVATVQFTYPIPAEAALRTLNMGIVPGLVSMLMGAAKDLSGR